MARQENSFIHNYSIVVIEHDFWINININNNNKHKH